MSDDDELRLWKRRARRWKRRALVDALTGLPNRRAWDNLVERTASDDEGGVIVLDLDGLKALNDSEGHTAGDALLRRASEALWVALQDDGIPFRIGGDEFALLVSRGEPEALAAQRGNRSGRDRHRRPTRLEPRRRSRRSGSDVPSGRSNAGREQTGGVIRSHRTKYGPASHSQVRRTDSC
ncbi:MAG: GGDEF domain-containing protein [Pirellulales bacterium]